MASKIVVIGSLEGDLSTVFEKLLKLQAKNNFSFAIVVGDLFPDPSTASEEHETTISLLLEGKVTVPLPTYFTIGKHALPEKVIERLEQASGEVCQNLYFLGKRSTTKTSEGIRIVALGGQLDPNITAGLSKDKYLPFHTDGDAKSLHGANTADILLTSTWPASIRRGSSIMLAEGLEDPASEQCVADLCATLKPRYHFSSTPAFFYEREPFFHAPTDSDPDIRPLTRFISLASPSAPTKAKYLYAFSLDPSTPSPDSLPPGTTASPLTAPRKRHHQPNPEMSYSRFSSTTHHRPLKRTRQPPPTPSECFFCLSNPSLATHLITSIATDTYLTTAKGPLSTSQTFPALAFPAHILLIPLIHAPTLASIPDPATHAELHRYRNALHAMLLAKAAGKLGSVTWEVSRADGIHIHWQFLPVAAETVQKGLVEAAFRVEAENEHYPPFQIDSDTSPPSDYFRVMIWRPSSDDDDNGPQPSDAQPPGVSRSLVLPLSHAFRFDLQFGRRVMAKLLGLETRLNWRDCAQDEKEEVEDAEAFKKAFEAFDFSREG